MALRQAMTILRGWRSVNEGRGSGSAREMRSLEQTGVEVVARDDNLHQHEETTEWNGGEAVDEGSVEGRWDNESACESSDDEVLPQTVLCWFGEELVELDRSVRHAQLVAHHLVVGVESGDHLAEVESVRLLEELCSGAPPQD